MQLLPSLPSPRAGRRPRDRAAVVAVLMTLALAAMAACGSNVAPETAMRAASDGTAVQAPQTSTSGVRPDQASTGSASDVGTGQAPATSGGVVADTGDAAPGTTAAQAGRDTARGDAARADCTDLPDQLGVTKDAITIANISDIGGPVPGVFQSAQDAVTSFAAYINSTGGVCGRQLKVLALDSRADAGANQVAYARACTEVLAAVGSMSVFDQGAQSAGECGMPDLHAITVSREAFDCPTCFGAASINPHLQLGAMAKYVLDTYGPDAQKVAVLYVNVNGVADAAQNLATSWKRVGVGVQYVQPIDVAEFNYAPYVQRLQDEGIKIVHYIGPYQFTVRLQQAMQQQGYRPTAFIQDQTIYSQEYVDNAGSLGDGTVVYGSSAMYTDRSNPEMQLYLDWLGQAHPGADPTPYGVFAWSAARLFVDLVTQLGPDLSRQSLTEALRRTRGWTGHGITSAQDVGTKVTGKCIRVVQLDAGAWKQVSPGDYVCAPLIPTP